MKTRISMLSVLALIVALTPAATPLAAAPLGTGFTYQGQLKENGVPKDGTAHLRFSLWDAAGVGSPPVGGSQIGVSQLFANVPVANGLFTVLLNAGGQFGANAFAGEARWLQVEVCADPGCGTLTILAPRQPLTAAPHALFAPNASAATTATTAANATQFNGQSAAYYQNASNISSGTLADARQSANVALLNSTQTFTGAKTFSLAPSFSAAGSPFSVTSTTKVTNLNADLLDGLDSSAFLQSTPNPLTLIGTSATHIIKGENASTTSGASGVFGEATAATGATHGGWFESASTSGRGVTASATAATGVTIGVLGQSDSNSGRGLTGWAKAATGTTYGVVGTSDSTSGRGVNGSATAATGTTYGVVGTSESTSGRGVSGSATAASGATYGVYGSSSSPNGTGVYGVSTSSVLGYGIGVHGVSYSFDLNLENGGVFGESFGDGGEGVVGRANVGSTAAGVWGISTSGNAGYFSGDVQIIGALSKSSGSFKIDHPLDPANKYLVHSFVESPDMMNIYNSNVVTGPDGLAWVELPAYFETLNRDFRYQLTVVGQFAQAIVAEKVQGNRFAIRTDKPGVEVSWQVTGVRQDPWAEAHRIQVEPEKHPASRGKYLNPELYGQPDELGESRSMAATRVAAAKAERLKQEPFEPARGSNGSSNE